MLLERTTRRIVLTEKGSLFYRRAVSILALAEEAKREAMHAEEIAGDITITAGEFSAFSAIARAVRVCRQPTPSFGATSEASPRTWRLSSSGTARPTLQSSLPARIAQILKATRSPRALPGAFWFRAARMKTSAPSRRKRYARFLYTFPATIQARKPAPLPAGRAIRSMNSKSAAPTTSYLTLIFHPASELRSPRLN